MHVDRVLHHVHINSFATAPDNNWLTLFFYHKRKRLSGLRGAIMELQGSASSDDKHGSAYLEPIKTLRNAVLGSFENRWIWAVATACLLLLQASLVIIHEPWADEWQALQIAMLSPDFAALLENLRYEGHPPLWYAILRFIGIFAHPLSVLMIAQLVIALSTQALILTRMPLPKWQRLCIALSYFLLIEYGTVSRSYSLGALVLIAFFLVRSPLLRWAAVILLPMVDFQFGLLSIVAMAILWRDSEFSVTGLGLWVMSSLFAAWTVLPAPDMIAAQYPPAGLNGLLRTFSLLSSQLIPLHVFPGRVDWGLPWPGSLGVIMGVIFIWMGDLILRRQRFHQMIFHAFLWVSVIFSSTVYAFGIRHFTLVPILLILLVAADRRQPAMQHLLFKVWIAIAAAAGIFGAYISFVMPFDVSDRAAAFIKARGLEKEVWVGWPDFTSTGLSSRLQSEMGSMKKDCSQAFNRWNSDHRFAGAESMAAAFDQFADKYGNFYISSTMKLDDVGSHIKMRQIAYFPAGYSHYYAHLYHVAYDRPSTGQFLKPCVPTRLPISEWADPKFRYGWRF
jgi:hypothetical protein